MNRDSAEVPPDSWMPWWTRAVRFGLVGGTGVLVDMLVLHGLAGTGGVGFPLAWAKVLSVETALLNSFLCNERWTFRDRTGDAGGFTNLGRRLLRFHVICLLGMGIGVGVLHILHLQLRMNLYLSNLLAIAAAAGWNFSLRSL